MFAAVPRARSVEETDLQTLSITNLWLLEEELTVQHCTLGQAKDVYVCSPSLGMKR